VDAATCEIDQPPARRPWVAAAAGTTGAIGVLVGSTLWGATRAESSALVRIDVAVAVVSLAVVPWIVRRAAPGGVAAGLLVALSPVATPVASFAVLFTARHRPFRQGAAVAAVGVAGEAVQGLWRPFPGLSYAWWLVLMTAAYAALLGWGTWARARHALMEALRERARRAEQDQARRVVEARVAERNRIAREMHDGLAHRLSLLAAYAGALEYRADAPVERLSTAAGVIRTNAHQALEELREVIHVLRRDEGDPEADDLPGHTLADLPGLVDEARAAGQSIEVEDLVGLPVDSPPLVGRTAYRVVQEALTNARKHAGGQPVFLTLVGEPGSRLTISVRNPTIPGTGTLPGAGTGLIGLTERVTLAGGGIEYHVDAAGQFRLDAWLPWPA